MYTRIRHHYANISIRIRRCQGQRFNEIPAARDIAVLFAKRNDQTLFGMGFTNSEEELKPLIEAFGKGAIPKSATAIGIFTEKKPGDSL